MFNMQEVKSSQMKKIGYNLESKKMRIEFNTGAEYDYDDVSPEEFAAFNKEGESLGRNFNQQIRGKKAYKKVVKDIDGDDNAKKA